MLKNPIIAPFIAIIVSILTPKSLINKHNPKNIEL